MFRRDPGTDRGGRAGGEGTAAPGRRPGAAEPFPARWRRLPEGEGGGRAAGWRGPSGAARPPEVLYWW
ncbi:hypothetical protein GCM10022630_20760 [Thermobifida alba]